MAQGETQESLAEKLSVTLSYVGRVERGEKDIRLSTLVAFAGALDLCAWQLIRDAEL